MNTYIFLQHYWWPVVLPWEHCWYSCCLQGGNSLLFCLGKTEEQKKMMINSTDGNGSLRLQRSSRFGGAFFCFVSVVL